MCLVWCHRGVDRGLVSCRRAGHRDLWWCCVAMCCRCQDGLVSSLGFRSSITISLVQSACLCALAFTLAATQVLPEAAPNSTECGPVGTWQRKMVPVISPVACVCDDAVRFGGVVFHAHMQAYIWFRSREVVGTGLHPVWVHDVAKPAPLDAQDCCTSGRSPHQRVFTLSPTILIGVCSSCIH